MPEQETNTTQQQPVVIRQGGNGLGTVIAAIIVAAAAVYAVNVWSTTKKETSPAKNLEQGIERIKDAAGKAMESRN
jgi:heme/copper-type cytochrome/quinol oxidase subunit 2